MQKNLSRKYTHPGLVLQSHEMMSRFRQTHLLEKHNKIPHTNACPGNPVENFSAAWDVQNEIQETK